jgi:hypothetical protein
MLVAVVAVALALGYYRESRRRAAYYTFVAGAYKLEAYNHGMFVGFYDRLAADRRRQRPRKATGYQDAMLYTNDYGGRLTTARQDEWNPHAERQRDPDRERDIARLRTLAVRERARAAYFAGLAAKYRRAARFPLLPVAPNPLPPE